MSVPPDEITPDPQTWSTELPSGPPMPMDPLDTHEPNDSTATPAGPAPEYPPGSPRSSTALLAVFVVLSLAVVGVAAALIIGPDTPDDPLDAPDPLDGLVFEPLASGEWQSLFEACDQVGDSTVLVAGRVSNLTTRTSPFVAEIDVSDASGRVLEQLAVPLGTLVPGQVAQFRTLADIAGAPRTPRCEVTAVLAGA